MKYCLKNIVKKKYKEYEKRNTSVSYIPFSRSIVKEIHRLQFQYNIVYYQVWYINALFLQWYTYWIDKNTFDKEQSLL